MKCFSVYWCKKSIQRGHTELQKIDSCAAINMSFNLHMVYTIKDITKHEKEEALFVMIIKFALYLINYLNFPK